MPIVTRLPTPVRRIVRAAGFAGLTGGMVTAYAAHDVFTAAPQKDALRDAWVQKWADISASM